MKNNQLLNLVLTAIIAIATCLATYFSYQSIKLSHETFNLNKSANFKDTLRLIIEGLKTVEELRNETINPPLQPNHQPTSTP